ncbi:S8 family peptidase [Pseudonocardia abyssalis]|uniref:S8 family peptidase n=1 Tax=Pseudonocardia abyssalis TaxID=2792008 RepID=A0ABS6UZ26_9PSEU|nr:S8/S53 family peptidase [Pseudonocardia abyssalis]MBW0113937.1 S8 family peptidase [Pseudonocardia abyssalis]MBW0136979.1 S8 family peptidase [Pseudonocardia abyssalis]
MSPKMPFGEKDYPDRRTPEQRDREQAETRKQVRTLARRAADDPARRRLVERLRDRRAGDSDALQIELVRRVGGPDVVAASQRLLIHVDDLPAAESALAERGIVETARGGNIVLLQVPGSASGDGIAGLAEELRKGGADVALDLVVPLGGWVKGEGGPEPTAGRRAFPAVRIAQVTDPPFVAVLDTGISNAGRTDGYLGAEIVPADVDPLDVFPQFGLLDGDAGHGSMVVGIVQQVAPTTRVGSYRVADTDGVTSSFDLAQAMRLAAADGARIMNLSLGTGSEDGRPPPALLDVVTELLGTRPELLIVCAAGNDGSTNPIWPAAFAATHSNVVAVAALQADGADARWSTHGPWVTCSTIGQGVASTYVVGKEDGDLIGDPAPDCYEGPDPWAVWTGTSFAAPQIAGAIARICSETGLTPPKALDELKSRATPAAVPSTGYGWTVEILPGT